MKKTLLTLVLFAMVHLVKAQAIGYYPFNSMLSIASNPNKVFWMDFRFQMNSYFSSLSTEISPMINFRQKERANFYVGGGLKANFLNTLNPDENKRNILEGYFLNVGMRASPIEKLPKFQLIFELSPYSNTNFDLGVFRANLGIAYILR